MNSPRRRGLGWKTSLAIMALSASAFLAMGIAGGSAARGLLAAPFGAIFGWYLAAEIYQFAQLVRGTSRTLFAPKSKWIWLVSLLAAISVATPLVYLFDLSMLAIGAVLVVSFVATAIACDVGLQIAHDLSMLATWFSRFGRMTKKRSGAK
ncbi:hypothetical protein LOC69_08440 [Blastopirellula sp. JC733]|nr:hypothetical protein [Blastopirellula sediminis]